MDWKTITTRCDLAADRHEGIAACREHAGMSNVAIVGDASGSPSMSRGGE